MPYLGNVPAEAYSTTVKNSWNGDGSTTDFTLSQPSTTNNLRVVVENVIQDPAVAYTVTGTTLSFSSAPPVGTANIYAIHLGPATQTAVPPSEITSATTYTSDLTVQGDLTVDTDTLYVDAANNRVGIGTASPSDLLELSGDTAQPAIRLTDADVAGLYHRIFTPTNTGLAISADAGDVAASSFLRFDVDGSEAFRVDENGTFCIGKTSTSFDDSGINIFGYGSAANQERINVTRSGGVPLNLNRLNSDGSIIRVFKDGTTVGHIGANGGNPFFATDAGSTKVGILMVGGSMPRVLPCNSTGTTLDNTVDLGHSSARYDDLWATNNVIQTSDANEKQDVAELDEAERRVATAAKGLIRKYRWIDSVEEKGDDARIHVGVIAQDLKAAFEAEGLDPGRYAMFISSTWWEADETYTDDEGVEQTRTNTYDTAEEAPENAVERTRLGVRYNQLLAFIIGAI